MSNQLLAKKNIYKKKITFWVKVINTKYFKFSIFYYNSCGVADGSEICEASIFNNLIAI